MSLEEEAGNHVQIKGSTTVHVDAASCRHVSFGDDMDFALPAPLVLHRRLGDADVNGPYPTVRSGLCTWSLEKNVQRTIVKLYCCEHGSSCPRFQNSPVVFPLKASTMTVSTRISLHISYFQMARCTAVADRRCTWLEPLQQSNHYLLSSEISLFKYIWKC